MGCVSGTTCTTKITHFHIKNIFKKKHAVMCDKGRVQTGSCVSVFTEISQCSHKKQSFCLFLCPNMILENSDTYRHCIQQTFGSFSTKYEHIIILVCSLKHMSNLVWFTNWEIKSCVGNKKYCYRISYSI